VDCVFGLVIAFGAILGTIVGLLIGYTNHPQEPRFDGVWLVVVVPIAAYFVGAAIGSIFESLLQRFRPAGEVSVLSHDGRGTEPPAAVLVLLGMVFLIAPAIVAIVLILFAAGLIP